MTINVTDTTFTSEVLESSQPVVVDFWAPWCSPCKALTPVIDSLAEEYDGRVKFVKVNIDDTTLSQKYGIRGVPTLMFFKNGEIMTTHVGNIPKGKLTSLVDSTL